MTRVTSDATETHRGEVVRGGGWVGVRLPDGLLDPGTETRLTFDGTTHHARVGRSADGPVVRGAFDTRGDLRVVVDDADGPVAASDVPDRLREWLATADLADGDPVAVDEVDAGRHYGLRLPGDRVTYDLRRRPDDSLADIADQTRPE